MFLEKSGISAEEVKTIVVKLLSFLFNIYQGLGKTTKRNV